VPLLTISVVFRAVRCSQLPVAILYLLSFRLSSDIYRDAIEIWSACVQICNVNIGRPCGPVVTVPDYRSRGAGSNTAATRFSK
jgi:hypothetical protein